MGGERAEQVDKTAASLPCVLTHMNHGTADNKEEE